MNDCPIVESFCVAYSVFTGVTVSVFLTLRGLYWSYLREKGKR